MLRTCMIADYLRPYAQWRIDRPGPRNVRAAIGLIDAAAYVEHLDESSRVIVRMAKAGCFALGRFNPGAEGEQIIRAWHYDDAAGGPADLLEALASAAEQGLQPRPREAETTPA